MLSLFPELLFLAPFSALLIRLAGAAVMGHITIRHLQNRSLLIRGIGAVEGICATLLFLGLYTQGAALLGVVIAGTHVLFPHIRVLPLSTMFLFLIMSLSLLVTGPGPFTVTFGGVILPVSFDLPL